MQLTIGAEKLKEMVLNAIKGASNNRMVPITGLIGIEVKNNTLTLSTTDASNHFRVRTPLENDDFYAVIQAELFSKLVQKITTEKISLIKNEELGDNSLEIHGNGVYKMELPLDETGQPIRFPEFVFNEKGAKTGKIKLSDIKNILKSNRAALAQTMERPCLTGYYFSEQVITTDIFVVCCNAVSVFGKDQALLLPPEIVDLLGLMTEEEIEVKREKDKLLFKTENMLVYGTQLEDAEKYPAAALDNWMKTAFISSCKFSNSALLAVLDRLYLFVTDYDKNAIYLTFSEKELIITSKKNTGTESIKLEENNSFEPFTCCIDIEYLRTQIMAQVEGMVEMWYGHNSAIKMAVGSITQIVGLLEDDRKG